jgi:hypothetical protein
MWTHLYSTEYNEKVVRILLVVLSIEVFLKMAETHDFQKTYIYSERADFRLSFYNRNSIFILRKFNFSRGIPLGRTFF